MRNNITSLDDFKSESKQGNTKAERKERLLQLRTLEQAAISSDKVTGSPEWDKFLTYFGGQRKDLTDAYNNLQDALNAPQCVQYETLVAIKLQMAYLRGQLDNLLWAEGLPKQLHEGGDAAKSFIAELELQVDEKPTETDNPS